MGVISIDKQINMADEDYAIEASGDAGASHTINSEAGQIRKGGHIVIKGRPCKVVDVSTSKTGKHGHAKAHFVALDIFTGKKMEELCPTSHNATVPNVTREDFQVVDCEVGEPGEPVSLMNPDTGDMKDDLDLPPNADLCQQIKSNFDSGADTYVTVVSAMKEDQIMSTRTTQEQAPDCFHRSGADQVRKLDRLLGVVPVAGYRC